MDLFERDKPTHFVEASRSFVALVGVRRPEGLDLQVLDTALTEVRLGGFDQRGAEALSVALPAHTHDVELGGVRRMELQREERVAVVRDGRTLLDCRTITDAEVDEVAAAVLAAR